ncbi:MAG: PD-(D/E)XK nuclease family protein [Nitrospirota bacterium]
MLRIVTGPFQPDLEQALAEEIGQFKRDDPFASLAVVVPSSLLLTRLRDLLVLERRQPLLNVHFLTFHQLALRLYEERSLRDGGRGVSRLEVVPDFFFEQLLGHVARRGLDGTEALRLAELGPGAWAVLWTTLRDLKDAMVDPGIAMRGVGEGLFDTEEAPKLRALFTLDAALREASRSLGVGSVDDLAAAVTPWVPESRFLARFRRLCYYGFYDLTQVQLSLFQTVAEAAPVTLYFPPCEGEAFVFARRFYDRHVQPLVRSSEQVRRLPAMTATAWPPVRIMSAVGAEDELALACKEILTLVETHGYRFGQIGLVARTLEPYRTALRRSFDQHRIPFTTTATCPAIQEPAVKVLLQLAALPLAGFYRSAVMDVLTSPFYRMEEREKRRGFVRPDLWRLAVQALGITRGEEEWRRLASAGRIEVWPGAEDEPEEEQGRPVTVEAPHLRLLWQLVSRMIEDCRALPAEGGFGDLTDAFMALASKHLTVPGFDGESGVGEEEEERLAPLGSVIRDALARLRQLDRIGGTVTWEEWVRLLARTIEQATVTVGSENHEGVFVLDAMAARGLPFRALFLLGMNEKVFPRFIREDAFLRDRSRLVLDATLGYKIDQKLAGYDEEQLLFALLRQAASDRLYLLYQRADAEGRPLAVSPYLDPFQLHRAEGAESELRLPRRLADRTALPQWSPALLTREELAQWLILKGDDPSRLLETMGREGLLFRKGREVLDALEGDASGLGPHDGLVGRLDAYWEQVMDRGLAPTPLEQYARCPFQYWASQVLRLEPAREQPGGELPPRVLGELCHDSLRICYQRLSATGWPQEPLASDPARALAASAVERAFTAYAAEHGTGYALLWQLAQDTVVGLVLAAIQADQEEARSSGFRPVGFEVEGEGRIEGLAARGPLKIRGRFDRVDQRLVPPGLRIVDYKYKQSRKMKPEDRDLLAAAVRGYRLQPPLYTLMTVPGQDRAGTAGSARPELVEFIYLTPRRETPVDRRSFEAGAWDGPAGNQLKRSLKNIAEGIEKGSFFIVPDGYCDHCDFSAACRRFHGPTWMRAYRADPARALRQLRKQKVAKNGDQ